MGLGGRRGITTSLARIGAMARPRDGSVVPGGTLSWSSGAQTAPQPTLGFGNKRPARGATI